MNNDNLIPTNRRSKDEARELGRAGGKASGKVRRERKTLMELCKMIGQMKSTSATLKDLPASEKTKDAEVAMAMYNAAKAGDTKAAAWIRDTLGETKTQVEVTEKKEIEFVLE